MAEAKPWAVVSMSIFGEYRRRSFKTERGAKVFMLLREIFYLMPSAFPTWARLECARPPMMRRIN